MGEPLTIISLREQVYTYLRQQLSTGVLVPGATINIGEIANQLGISKTPLRDALIHLEVEGFVTILPRKGVRVNRLELIDVKHAYNAIGVVESSIVLDCFQRITPAHIDKLEALNKIMITDITNDDFTRLFTTNLEFHNVYISLSGNTLFKQFMRPIKHRLYDFPRQNYLKDWELRNCDEHQQFITFLKQGKPAEAASVLKDVHWSFEFQQTFIKKFYKVNDVSG
ncbi:MAG: GntR family transcriptional regulator [Desulfotignum sp.]|nr:GntR family transcriptional regulator [Desulfotignum sp.]